MRNHSLLAFVLAVPLSGQDAPRVTTELGDRPVARILDDAAGQLGWNILYHGLEIDAAERRPGVKPGPECLELLRTEAAPVLSRWLLGRDLALVPLVREHDLYLVVSRRGPRRGLCAQGAAQRTPQEVLAQRESGSYVWTVVPLASAAARDTAKALRSKPIHTVATAAIAPREAILALGPACDVAATVERVRALDLAAGEPAPQSDAATEVDALAAEVIEAEKRIAALEERIAVSRNRHQLVLPAGEHTIEDLTRVTQVQLGWSMLANRAELRLLAPATPLRLQSELRLTPEEARPVLSQILFSAGFTMTVLDRDRDLYEIIGRNGPRRSEIANRAELLAVDQVLAARTASIPATTVVPLRYSQAQSVASQLRPLFARMSGVTLGAIGAYPAILVQGLAPDVAMVVDIVAELDWPARGTGAVGWTAVRITDLERRVAALESRPDGADTRTAERFTLPPGELSLKALFVTAERVAGVPFRIGDEDPRPWMDAAIVLPHELSCAREDVVPMVARMTSVFGRALAPAATGEGYTLLPALGPRAPGFDDYAAEKSANEVLALRSVPMPVRVAVELRTLNSRVVVNSLRPMFGGGISKPVFAAESNPPRVIVTALAPQAASIIELLRACDRAGPRPESEEKRALADLRERVQRLERQR